jgi:hypothetical protein
MLEYGDCAILTQEPAMVYRGHVRNGKIELDEPTELPEGSEVEVILRQETGEDDGGDATLYEQLEDLIGSVPGLPEDLSVNHDHYLYGAPKRR